MCNVYNNNKERDLFRFLLDSAELSDSEIDCHLGSAAALGVDVLDYCARRLGLGEHVAFQRAAAWSGVEFCGAPRGPAKSNGITLDRLATVRRYVHWRNRRLTAVIAPRFEEVIALQAEVSAKPRRALAYLMTTPGALRSALADCHREALVARAQTGHTRIWSRAAAETAFPAPARWAMLFSFVGLASFVIGACLSGDGTAQTLLSVSMVVTSLPKILAALSPLPPVRAAVPVRDCDLPHYSVLLPLHREAAIVPQLAAAMRALNYPPEKLDIFFVVEASSPETIEAVRAELDEPRFNLVVIPEALPLTKPKALNAVLPLIQEGCVVVFDAEDMPEPNQLLKAANRFAADPDLAVLQGELIPDNAADSWIAGLFTAEYLSHFGVMLHFITASRLPVALGGTSNHFRTAVLKSLGGWDASNVTEDADLGIKLARRGYRVGMLDSATREEAPVSVGAWLRQRARWSKGWMQTALAHGRDFPALLRDLGLRNTLFLALQVIGNLYASTIHACFAVVIVGALFIGDVQRPSLAPGLVATLLTYGAALVLIWRGLSRADQLRLAPLNALLPLYWMLHAVATWQGAIDAVRRPHYWAKTTHGLGRRQTVA